MYARSVALCILCPKLFQIFFNILDHIIPIIPFSTSLRKMKSNFQDKQNARLTNIWIWNINKAKLIS